MSKKIFFTSDFHFNHQNIIKYSNRPFENVEEMNKILIRNYNNTVSSCDICYILGDLGDFDFSLNVLNGFKILLKGNHDKKTNKYYLDRGIDVIMNRCGIFIGKQLVTMSHYPLSGIYREDVTGMKFSKDCDNWHKESFYKDKNLVVEDNGQYHLHGHLHLRKGRPFTGIQTDRQFDVGVDGNNLYPVSYEQVLKWMQRNK